jgi:hypothetical protein
MSFTLVFILTLSSIYLGNAEESITRIFYNENDTAVQAVAAIGSPAACHASLFILTNSSSDCLSISNSTSNSSFDSLGCEDGLEGSTALSCLSYACYVLNPVFEQIVVLNNNGMSL